MRNASPPPMSPADPPATDPGLQAELRAAFSPAAWNRLLDGLAEALRAEAETLTQADPVSASEAAHRLAGAAGMYGFPRMSALARAVETDLRAGLSPAAALWDAFDAERAALPARITALRAPC